MRAVIANLAIPPQAEKKATPPANNDEPNPFAEEGIQQQTDQDDEHSSAPLGLSLLPPLFFAHELNPVNEKAQSLVAIPDGLDLESWISPGSIPSAPSSALITTNDQVDEFGRPRGGFSHVSSEVDLNGYGSKKVKKSKKEKSKTEDGSTKKVCPADFSVEEEAEIGCCRKRRMTSKSS